MSISQSRANSRGPLIAVIKIQIHDDQVDRIFLHQNDDDYKLAQQFQQKHRLNPHFIEHIYQKIKASRQSLQKDTIPRTPVPLTSQRSVNVFNPSNYSNTPLQNENSYRPQYENFPTPFDRINKYTAMQQQKPEQLNKKSIETITKQQYESRHRNLFEDYQKQQLQDTQIKYTQNNSTFQTFMQPQIKTKNNKELFEKYLEQRKKHNTSSQQTKRLIEKSNTNPNSYYQSRDTFQLSRQNRSSSTEAGKLFHINTIEQNQKNKQHVSSHYSFNEQKPSKVKILRKQQIQSLKSSKKSISKVQKQKIAKLVTNRLYNESEIKKNYLNKIKQRAKIQKQEKQDKQLTYRPQINKLSQLIAADRYKDVPLQQYLVDKAKVTQVKRQAERALKTQKQLQNCTFKPEINVISQKLVRNNSRSILKESHNKTLQYCSKKHSHSQMAFRPSLNKMSQKIVQSKNQGNFQQRLKGYLQQKNNKLKQLTKQKRKKQTIDQSGQQLFRPRISNKSINRSPKGSQIHDYLYQLSKIPKQIPKIDQKPVINENSQQIMQQIYIKRLGWLFSELDSDQDGFISPKRICIDTINQQILQVIIPVLLEMEQMDIQLNLMDFRNAIKNLHPSLNAYQKSILYNYNQHYGKNNG